MLRSVRNCCLCGVLALLGVPDARGAVITSLAVAVNDMVIAPTNNVSVVPGDLVTIEFYISGWDADLNGSSLQAYQVGLDGVFSYHSGSTGRLVPLGWDAIWPEICYNQGACPAEIPFCSVLADTCGCINGQPSCPVEYPTCFLELCVGAKRAPVGVARCQQDR